MNDITVNTTTAAAAIVQALQAAELDASSTDLVEIDNDRLSDTESARQALEEAGDRGALLHNLTPAHRQILFPLLGIQAKGSTPLMLVRRIGRVGSRNRYHIIDVAQVTAGVEGFERAEGIAPADATPPPVIQADPIDSTVTETPDVDIVAQFAATVADVWELPKTLSAADGPIEHLWIYTRSSAFYPTGKKSNDYTPPSDQLVTVNITYTFRAFLNDAESGKFQWLYVETLGHLSPNGMKKNDHNRRGWGNGSVEVSVPAPSGVPLFYDASPANTNNEKSVTTTVGFDVGYQTGSLSYSQSQTETIRDWRVLQQKTDAWLYEMSSPFKGNTNKFPDDGVKYNAGKARHEVKSWPDLTTNVFRWSTMSVYRNSAPTSKVVSVFPEVKTRAIFMYVRNFWPTWKGSYWWSYITLSERFDLDFSVVDD
ncbi:MAG: hypothetical protein KDI51_09240 [Xanthomonadales bacterium]|nr:hypothetical protein [Xanthomonadales bacterium]MCB1634761.1 hypothetical protein [Xanthomonadales bacterium]